MERTWTLRQIGVPRGISITDYLEKLQQLESKIQDIEDRYPECLISKAQMIYCQIEELIDLLTKFFNQIPIEESILLKYNIVKIVSNIISVNLEAIDTHLEELDLQLEDLNSQCESLYSIIPLAKERYLERKYRPDAPGYLEARDRFTHPESYYGTYFKK